MVAGRAAGACARRSRTVQLHTLAQRAQARLWSRAPLPVHTPWWCSRSTLSSMARSALLPASSMCSLPAVCMCVCVCWGEGVLRVVCAKPRDPARRPRSLRTYGVRQQVAILLAHLAALERLRAVRGRGLKCPLCRAVVARAMRRAIICRRRTVCCGASPPARAPPPPMPAVLGVAPRPGGLPAPFERAPATESLGRREARLRGTIRCGRSPHRSGDVPRAGVVDGRSQTEIAGVVCVLCGGMGAIGHKEGGLRAVRVQTISLGRPDTAFDRGRRLRLQP